MQTVRVRFAPSPTGYLHIGSLRTALYNYLFAKKNNGTFILRIEDTDRTRYVEGAVENLIAALNWAGITYDEGPDKEGDCGPYVQSMRLPLYTKYANKLIEEGHAYYCFCSPERLEQVRERQIAAKLPPAYDRHCRNLDLEIVHERIKSEQFVIRMKIPLEGESVFNDLVRGSITISYKNIDDQVLVKSDGFPTYHLAVVIDDRYMKITHVIRGEEWLSSTPKHVLLYEYLGWQAPEFAHLPLLLNPDRTKLSKRQGDVAVEDYRAKGYTKDALVNFVALLGWNPGGTEEIFSLNELIEKFSLEHVNKSGSVFDVKKLEWMNGLYIRKKSSQELLNLIETDIDPEFFKKISKFNRDQVLLLINLYKEKAKTLSEISQAVLELDKVPANYDQAGLTEFVKIQTKDYLSELIQEAQNLQEWETDKISSLIKEACKKHGIKLPDLTQPIRLALTGTVSSPGVFELLKVMSKEESLKRLNIFLELINKK